jgi:hypothetical protein
MTIDTVTSIIAIIIASLSLIVSLAALGVTLGMKWSTHRIEWKPIETFDPVKEAEKETEEVEEEDGKTLENALELQRKGKKPKLQDPLETILEDNNF